MILQLFCKKVSSISYSLIVISIFFTCSLIAKESIGHSLTKKGLETSFQTLIGEREGGNNKERSQIRPQDVAMFQQLSKEYKKKKSTLTTFSKAAIIPKKLHFIWIGPKPFPEESIKNVRSWKRNNPDWKIYFWTDSAERPLPIPTMERRLIDEYDFAPLQDLIPLTTNWGEKSDLMRYAIIYNEGGIYADHDAECLKSFAPLIDNFTFFACLERPHYHQSIDTCVIPSNGLFGAVPRHIILKKTMEKVCEVWDRIGRQFPDSSPKSTLQRVIRRTFDSFAFTSIQWRNHLDYNDIILPTAYFYPDKTFTHTFKKKLIQRGIVFSSHKFAGAWREKPIHNKNKNKT